MLHGIIPNQRVKASELLFFLAYGMYLMVSTLSLTFFYRYFQGGFHKFIIFATLLILVVKEFCVNKLTQKRIFQVFLALMLFCMFWYVGRSFVGATFIFIWSSRDVKFHRIAKFTVVVLGCILLITISFAYLGFIENYLRTGSRTRRYMGFLYALYPAYIYCNFVALYVYLRKDSLRMVEAILLFAFGYFIYDQTDSRLAFCATTFVLIAGITLKHWPNIFDRFKFISLGMIFSYCICAAMSIVLTICYNNSVNWMNKLNSFLGSRLSLGLSSLQNYGVQLFGREISWHGNGLSASGVLEWTLVGDGSTYDFVDSLYISILQREGLIVFIILMIVITVAMVRVYKAKNYYILMFLALTAFMNIISNLGTYFHYCTFIFATAAILDPPMPEVYLQKKILYRETTWN